MRELIEQYRKAQPFQPFRIRTSSGVAYLIRHPDLLVVTANYVLIGYPHTEPSHADPLEVTFITMLHVTAVEVVVAATPPTVN